MNEALALENVFAELGGRTFDQLAQVNYCAGTTVFQEGEVAGCAYLIERGEVEITRALGAERKVLAVLGPGDLFGEMAPIDGGVRSAAATVSRDAVLIPIGGQQLEDLVNNADPLLNLLLRVLLERLRLTHGSETGTGSKTLSDAIKPVDRAYAAARERALGQVQLERALRTAIARREFELYLQPIVNLAGGDILGFEGLIRWLRPSEGMVMPVTFIDLAEETALIVPMGLWVLEHACHLLKRIQGGPAAQSRVFVSVNVSSKQLANPRHIDEMAQVIQRSGADPRGLKLEITERVLVENPELASEALAKFKRLGATIAIDDFGTGYSSLNYLHRFRLDTLKVDGSFVRSMLTDKGSMQIVRAVVALAGTMNMDTVAEGVESEAEIKALSDLGCQAAQGYWYSPPLPEAEALRLLDSSPPWRDR